MTDAAQKVFEEAMKLSLEERKRLVQQLLSSTAANETERKPMELSDEKRAELLEAIAEAEEDIDAGREVDEAEVWATLKAIG